MRRHAFEPEIGMGATYSAGSDRYPATIIEVNGKTLRAQSDTHVLLSGSDITGDAVYAYHRNPNGRVTEYTLRKNGYWIPRGCRLTATYAALSIGGRSYYQDPSF